MFRGFNNLTVMIVACMCVYSLLDKKKPKTVAMIVNIYEIWELFFQHSDAYKLYYV